MVTTWSHVVSINYLRTTADTVFARSYIGEGTFKTDTVELKKQLLQSLDDDANLFIRSHSHCQIDFWRASSKLKNDFIETNNDMLGGYMNDFVGTIVWQHGKIVHLALFRNGINIRLAGS